MIQDDPHFFRYVLFSDEATFCSDGRLNSRDVRFRIDLLKNRFFVKN